MPTLQLLMMVSSAHDGLVKGLHEDAKFIEKHTAQFSVLTAVYNQPDDVQLVTSLCTAHTVHLVHVPSANILGKGMRFAILTMRALI